MRRSPVIEQAVGAIRKKAEESGDPGDMLAGEAAIEVVDMLLHAFATIEKLGEAAERIAAAMDAISATLDHRVPH